MIIGALKKPFKHIYILFYIMCGIWGVISSALITKKQVKEWLELFNYVNPRGPDKSSILHINNIVHGFHRLAIHDLTPLGDQPFVFYSGYSIFILSVNGEIYNYKELVNKYNLHDYLKSDSDCEIIYHLLNTLGSIDLVAKELRGEYVFCFTEIDYTGKTYSYLCRDPYGVRPLFYSLTHSKRIMYGSLLKSVLDSEATEINVFPPGHIMIVTTNKDNCTIDLRPYYNYEYKTIELNLGKDLYKGITDRLINAVKIRLDSDRPIGALLSGGLDSSLVCGIASKVLGVKNLKTFSIGMNEGTDLKYGRMVSDHLGTEHKEIFFTPEEGLEALEHVMLTTETWDVTTIRASVGQYLLGKYISLNTDIKVILNGDGADEVEMGYLYFYLAPNAESAQEETVKLLREIHRYDGLRVDRCISVYGLEARLPFLDQDFVDYYMSIKPNLKIPTKDRMEKQLIRDAFSELYPDVLPKEVIYRKKEAFSDGVSSKEKSWFEIIGEWIELIVTDDEFMNRDMKLYEECRSKESYYYKKRFNERFGKECFSVIPHYWLPNWIETNGEPSARVLQVYK